MWSLVQNLMNLVFSSKMAKTKVVQKHANWRHSEAKG